MAFTGFMSRKTRHHTIHLEDGSEIQLQFLPVSMRRLLSLKDLIAVALKAITRLTENRDVPYRTRTNTDKDGATWQEMEPLERTEDFTARDEAVDDLTKTLLHDENMGLMAEVVLDSLRSEPLVVGATPQEFLDNTEVGALRQILVGFVKANEKVLPGVFKDRFQKAIETMLARLEPEGEKDPNPQPKPGEPSETDSEDPESGSLLETESQTSEAAG